MGKWVFYNFVVEKLLHSDHMLPKGHQPLVNSDIFVLPWRLTRATDLWCATASAVADDGHHPGTKAGASLLAAAAHCAQRRVWLAAVSALLGVDLPAHAGALQHAAARWRSHLPTGEKRWGDEWSMTQTWWWWIVVTFPVTTIVLYLLFSRTKKAAWLTRGRLWMMTLQTFCPWLRTFLMTEQVNQMKDDWTSAIPK